MPQLFFVRDGSGEHHTSQAHNVDIGAAKVVADQFGVRFSETGPIINGGIASPFAPYRHVVLEIRRDDVGPNFNRPGFYYVTGLSPEEARRRFHISQVRDA